MDEQAEQFKYWAFISYSHQDNQWASKLHAWLETYRVPKQLVGRKTSRDYPVPKRAFPIFRDRDELPSSADLGQNIEDALRKSRYLIVICSPRSAVSLWVNQEVKTFKALGREDRVLCIIVEGEPNATDKPNSGLLECFPPAIRFRMDAHGRLTEVRTEPIAGDARDGKDGFENARLKLLAGILGVEFDELKQRDKQRQNKKRIQMAVAMLAIIGMIAAVWVWQENGKLEQAKRAKIERWTEQGRQELLKGSPLRALPYLNEAYQAGGTGTALTFLLARAIKALDSELLILGGPSDPIHSAQFSPNGSQLVTQSSDGDAKIWDVASGKSPFTLDNCCDRLIKPVFSPDGSRVLTSRGKTAKIWSAVDGQLITTLAGHKLDITTATYSHDGKRIVTSATDDTAKIWDADSGKLVTSLSGHTATVRAATFSPDGTKVLTVSFDETAKMWDATTGATLFTVSLQEEGMFPMAFGSDIVLFNRDGSRVLILAQRQLVKLCDTISGKVLASRKADKMRFLSAAFIDGDRASVFELSENKVAMVDVETGRTLTTFEGHKGAINHLDLDPSASRIVTASWDSTARVWDAASGTCLEVLEDNRGFLVVSANYNKDATRLVTVDGEGFGRIWDCTGGKLIKSLRLDDNGITSIAFSRDFQKIVTSNSRKKVKVWDAVNWTNSCSVTNFIYPLHSASFNHDGTRIVTTSGFGPSPSLHDTAARVWDVKNGQEVLALIGHTNQLSDAIFSPDGRTILTASMDQTVKLWNATNGTLLSTFAPPSVRMIVASVFQSEKDDILVAGYNERDGVLNVSSFRNQQIISSIKPPNAFFSSVHFSPDGSRLLTLNGDHTAIVWDTQTGTSRCLLESPVAFSAAASWSGDGSLIVTADSTAVRIWDSATGKRLTDLEGQAFVSCAAFDKTGSSLVTAGNDGFIKLWDLHLEHRSVAQIADLMKNRTPWKLVDNSLVPVASAQR